MLKFVAQLSLDFLFGGVKAIPNEGEEVLSKIFDIQLGGGTLVYPLVLSRLGVPCALLAKWQPSMHGELARGLLKSYAIHEVEMMEVDYDPIMTTAIISMEKDRSFVSHNDERAFQFSDEKLLSFYQDSDVVFAPETNQDIIHPLKRMGKTIVFDIGWQDDLDINHYKSLLKDVDYFTPNDKEAMAMTHTASVEDSVKVLSKYVKYPIVSCGEHGCLTWMDDTFVRVPVPKGIQPVDTTGAGDNFMAGLIYGIYKRMGIIESIKFATCTGSLSTQGIGCYGYPYTLKEILNMKKEITIEIYKERKYH